MPAELSDTCNFVTGRLMSTGKAATIHQALTCAILAGCVTQHSVEECVGEEVVFRNPERPFTAGGLVWTSTLQTDGTGFLTWDNVTLDQPVIVSSARWYGMWVSGPEGATTESQANAWNLGFWTNEADRPGTPLFETTLPSSSVDEVFRGFRSGNGMRTFAKYENAAQHEPLFLPAGEYWFYTQAVRSTPVDDPSGFNYVWDEELGPRGDSTALQERLSNSNFFVVGGDRAFTLLGELVDEPSGADFTLGIEANGDLGVANRSVNGISLNSLEIDFSVAGGQTFFDTSDAPPGLVGVQGISVSSNLGIDEIGLPDAGVLDGLQSATITFNGFDTAEAAIIEFDLDRFDDIDSNGQPGGGRIIATFSNGQVITRTLAEESVNVLGRSFAFSAIIPEPAAAATVGVGWMCLLTRGRRGRTSVRV